MRSNNERRSSRRWWPLLVLALAAGFVAACDTDDGDADPDTSTTTDVVEDTGPDIEACPSSGAMLQAAPVQVTLEATEVGETSTAMITVNSGGTGQLCFGSPIVELDPPVAAITVGPLTMGGSPVDALNPGEQGTIELTYAPTMEEEGQSLVSVVSENGGTAELQVSYDATPGTVVTPGDPIGELTLFANLAYIYDADRWFNEPGYRDSEPGGLMTSPALTGELDGTQVPSLDAAEIRAFVLHTAEPRLVVEQAGFATDVWTEPLAGPRLRIEFPDDEVAVGTVTLDPTDPSIPGHALFVALGNDGTGGECVLAVAAGELDVTEATDTTLAEGGALSLRSTSSIPLYDPLETPDGDVTSALEEVGYSVCP